MDAADRAASSGNALLETLRVETQAQTAVTGRTSWSTSRSGSRPRWSIATSGAVLGAVSPVMVPRDSVQRGVRLLRDRVMGMLAVRADERLRDVPGMLERPPTVRSVSRLRSRHPALQRAGVRRREQGAAGVVAARHHVPDSAGIRGDRGLESRPVRDHRFPGEDAPGRQSNLSEYFDLNVTYLENLLAGEGNRALQVVRQAAALAPGSRAPYNAARLALLTNHPAEALSLLTGMDPIAGLMRGWQSYWTQLSHALHLAADHERELGAMREMRRRYPDSRVAIVLEARALAALAERRSSTPCCSRPRRWHPIPTGRRPRRW
jgi:hypothetical protein